jgi:RHS repeat-associated protein
LNQTTTYSYDAVGNLIQETDPLGKSTTYAYDSLNRLKHVTDAAGGIAVYTYDNNGNMTSIQDPNRHAQTIVYDDSNRPVTNTDADGKITTNTYDAVGNVATVSMPNGIVKTIGYDDLYRPVSIGFSSGQNYSFTYDPNNNVSTAISPTGTESFQYDNLNRKTQFTDVFGNIVAYTYDYAGNRTGVTYPGNKLVAYQYNSINEITTVTDWLNKQTTYSYDATGRLSNMIYPNGIKCDYAYDLRNRLTQSSHYKIATSDTIYHSTMVLDGNGNRTQQTISGLPSLSLTPSTNSYTYTNADKLTDDGAFQYTNDDNGNRTSQTSAGNTTSFGFTAENLLNSITTSNSSTLFEYDAFGNRITKTVNGNPTKFVLDLSGGLSQVLQEQNSNGDVKVNYIFGLGLIASIDSADNIVYYHFDADGNTTLLTDDSSNVTDTDSYEPFGSILNHTGSAIQPYCFLGKYGVQVESDGLYYIRARYYDPNAGRFISKDSKPLSILKPQSINEFIYGLNNSFAYYDATGYSPNYSAFADAGVSLLKFGGNFSLGIFNATVSGLNTAAAINGKYSSALGATTHFISSVQNFNDAAINSEQFFGNLYTGFTGNEYHSTFNGPFDAIFNSDVGKNILEVKKWIGIASIPFNVMSISSNAQNILNAENYLNMYNNFATQAILNSSILLTSKSIGVFQSSRNLLDYFRNKNNFNLNNSCGRGRSW